MKVPGTFICSDVYDLPNVLHTQYDVIYMSYGVLCWLSNLKKWAKILHNLLAPGGMFYIVDLHPFTNMLSYEMQIAFRYFDKGPDIDDSKGTYTDWTAPIKGETYLWSHTMSDIINALLRQGLGLEFIHEFPYTMYDQFPGFMEVNDKGQYVLKNKKIQIPLLFFLKATK